MLFLRGAVSLTDSQLRFVRLHQRHFVEAWQGLLGGGMIRARTDRGVTATITKEEADGLIDAGILSTGWGGMFQLTEQGKQIGA